jgi:hypothetical protein
MHPFPTEQLTDDERQARVAGWIEAGVLGLKRARSLAEPHPAADLLDKVIAGCVHLAGRIRADKALTTVPVPEEAE